MKKDTFYYLRFNGRFHMLKYKEVTIFGHSFKLGCPPKSHTMEGEEIIRAYMLEPGDIFKIHGTVFLARKIENGRIYYTDLRHGQRLCDMGANSQERLILITNKTKQNEHQN